MRRERERKKTYDLSKTSATFSSRLESLNISEKGLICSLLNLSPLRKSMALSIRLLISSGPEWTCKACARWFGSRFIEFLVRAARVQRESTCTQNEPACPPSCFIQVTNEDKTEEQTQFVTYTKKGEDQNATFAIRAKSCISPIRLHSRLYNLHCQWYRYAHIKTTAVIHVHDEGVEVKGGGERCHSMKCRREK